MHGHTKTTRIKNVEEITVIKKTEEFREEQYYKDHDKLHGKKSPSSMKANKSQSSKKIKTMFMHINHTPKHA